MKTQVFDNQVEKIWIEDQGPGLKGCSCYIMQYRYIDCYITSVCKPRLFSSWDPDLQRTVSKTFSYFLCYLPEVSITLHDILHRPGSIPEVTGLQGIT